MLKRDPYNHKVRWLNWKEKNKKGIVGVSKHNSDLILSFLFDMELGKNIAPQTKKGERSYIRLNSLKDRLLFFVKSFNNKKLDKITKDYIHEFFSSMRSGQIVRKDGKPYIAVGEHIRDFKTFWGWLRRTGRVK
jgi:hypothetical protein